MLEINNVYKTFNAGTVNEKVALQDLNLTLEDGDFVTVIGGNGAAEIPAVFSRRAISLVCALLIQKIIP